MDMEFLKNDLREALNLLPREFVRNVAGEVLKNLPALAAGIEPIMEILKPTWKTATVELGSGMLKLEELAPTLVPLFLEYGVELPEDPASAVK